MAQEITDDESLEVGEPAPETEAAPPRSPDLTPAAVPRVIVPRWVQMVLLPLAIVGVYLVLRAAGRVLLLFTIAGLIALVLNPVVALLQRTRMPRGAAVALVMISLVALLTGIGFALSSPISNQASTFQRNVPGWVDDANNTLSNVQDWLDRKGIKIQVKKEGQTALQTLGDRVSGGTGSIVSFTRDALQTIVEGSLALILVIVLTIYMLLYGDRIGRVVRAVVPPGDGTPQDDFPTRIQAALFGYVRGQLLFSVVMGTSAGVVLYVLGAVGIFPEGKTYAIAFGAFYGFAELIPYVGPAIGGFPPVLIAALSDKPLDAVWLIIAFIVLQQLEGHVVAPQLFGKSLRINPLLVIFALLLGGQLGGFVGAFIALPIAAIVRESAVYFNRHLTFQRWDLPAAPPVEPPQEHCPECGASVPRGAEVCASCGTELDDSPAARASAPS